MNNLVDKEIEFNNAVDYLITNHKLIKIEK